MAAAFNYSHSVNFNVGTLIQEIRKELANAGKNIHISYYIVEKIKDDELWKTAHEMRDFFNILMLTRIAAHVEYGVFPEWQEVWVAAYSDSRHVKIHTGLDVMFEYPQFVDFNLLGTKNDIILAQKSANEERTKNGPPAPDPRTFWKILWDNALLRSTGGKIKITKKTTKTTKGVKQTKKDERTFDKFGRFTGWKTTLVNVPTSTTETSEVKVASRYPWQAYLLETIYSRTEWFLKNRSAGFWHQIVDGNLGSTGAYPIYGPDISLMRTLRAKYLLAVRNARRIIKERTKTEALTSNAITVADERFKLVENVFLETKHLRVSENLVLARGTIAHSWKGYEYYVDLDSLSRYGAGLYKGTYYRVVSGKVRQYGGSIPAEVYEKNFRAFDKLLRKR